MSHLPKYTVTVWYWDCVETMKYRELLIKATETSQWTQLRIKACMMYIGGQKNKREARAILKKLKPFISDPNVIVIRLSSLRDDFKPVVYKDERYI